MQKNIYNKKYSHIFALLLSVTQIFPSKLIAADFTITDGQVLTTQQELTGNETGTINNGGQLNVNQDAIIVSGADNSVNNAGSISTTLVDSDGVFSDNFSSNTYINNSGSIETAHDNANGILTRGSNDTIVSSGTITTNGTNARGIRSTGTNVNITHSGDINTQGDQSFGIVSTADGAYINHSGDITTTGIDSDGIRSSGTNAVIISSGNINANNDTSRGIRSTGDNVTIVNQGNITTHGTDALSFGIVSHGDSATISNSGTISVSGTNAVGIKLNGTNSTITNSGSIIATGSATQAIEGSVNDDILNIKSGSRIVGSIDLDAGNDVVNITGHTPYQTLTFANVETINALSTYTLVNSNTVTTVEPTRFRAEVNVIENFNSTIQHVLYQNMFNPASISENNTSDGSHVWTRAFAADIEHEQTSELLGYEHKVHGFIAGYEKRTGRNKRGIIVGYGNGDTDIMTSSPYKDKTDHDSFFTGIYGKYAIGEHWDMGLALNVGIQEHSTSRTIEDNINGSETADADFSSKYLAPSISFLEKYDYGSNWQVRSIVKAEAIWSKSDDYTESGTTSSNLKVDSRSSRMYKLRGDIESIYKFNANKSEVSLSLGYDYRKYKSDQVEISLGTGNLKFEIPGEDTANRTYFGVHMNHKLEDDVEIFGDIELGRGDEDSSLFVLGIVIRI
jgi:hypothetical protein